MKTETLLLEMRKEQREDHTTVVDKIDALAAIVHAHVLSDAETFSKFDKKLGPVLADRAIVRKLIMALVVALIGVGADTACNHIHLGVSNAQTTQAHSAHP